LLLNWKKSTTSKFINNKQVQIQSHNRGMRLS